MYFFPFFLIVYLSKMWLDYSENPNEHANKHPNKAVKLYNESLPDRWCDAGKIWNNTSVKNAL